MDMDSTHTLNDLAVLDPECYLPFLSDRAKRLTPNPSESFFKQHTFPFHPRYSSQTSPFGKGTRHDLPPCRQTQPFHIPHHLHHFHNPPSVRREGRSHPRWPRSRRGSPV